MLRIAMIAVIALLVVAGAFWLYGNRNFRTRMSEVDTAWQAIQDARRPPPALFDPAMLDGLPAVAQRYFRHAIAPGTPLATRVRLRMTGTFRLGDADNHRNFVMQARQLLAPPHAFVWVPRMRAGIMVIDGADLLHRGHAATRFWLFRAVPLVQSAGDAGLDRSALARPALESIWVPASLLPQNGARWEQIDDHRAKVSLGTGEFLIEMTLTIDDAGAVRDIVAQRWSNENPDRTYRLQPFGGTVEAEATFGGFTIPSHVSVGNHFGTADYFAFFDATIVAADYF